MRSVLRQWSHCTFVLVNGFPFLWSREVERITQDVIGRKQAEWVSAYLLVQQCLAHGSICARSGRRGGVRVCHVRLRWCLRIVEYERARLDDSVLFRMSIASSVFLKHKHGELEAVAAAD